MVGRAALTDPASRPRMLAVAPTGARRQRTDHPRLPLTPAEIADAAAASCEAGAAMLHLHVRDGDGRHILDPAAYRDATDAVRKVVAKRMIIQITTEGVGRYRPAEQMSVVHDLRPEAVSLALRELCPDRAHEAAFADFLGTLRRERIIVQHILYDRGDVLRLLDLVARGVVPDPQPAVLFVIGRHVEDRDPLPVELAELVTAAGGRLADVMVCAFGRHEAACCVAGALLGTDARVGFENNVHLPDGRRAPDNAALVAAVREPLVRLGCPIATADDVRARYLS